jgi:hypothetical protein
MQNIHTQFASDRGYVDDTATLRHVWYNYLSEEDGIENINCAESRNGLFAYLQGE